MYVASPHALHDEHMPLALEAGKHVLCEKPMTLDAAGTERALRRGARARAVPDGGHVDRPANPLIRTMLAAPRRRATTASRARCTPTSASLVETDPSDRLIDPALGAGALLDMGIYPLTLAHLVLGEPEPLAATATSRRAASTSTSRSPGSTRAARPPR